MTRDELKFDYFDWMYGLVCDTKYPKKLSYRKLLNFLHNMDFTYQLTMDSNRFEDGIELRYRFGYENGYDCSVIANYLDDSPCSVLEMLIALSIRLEEHIMDDPEIGDRTGQWFWNMITNLGLGSMDDRKFNENRVEDIVTRFLERQYEPDGQGGLFTLENCHYDLRKVEIWYQACWYLDRKEITYYERFSKLYF